MRNHVVDPEHADAPEAGHSRQTEGPRKSVFCLRSACQVACLLYTSDAADE